MFTIVHGSAGLTNNIDGSSNSHDRSLLDEIVREGAQRMLAVALQAEVAAYVERMPVRSTSVAGGWCCVTAAAILVRW